MSAARARDLIARQYCNGLADIFDFAVPALVSDAAHFGSLIRGIISTHLRLMALLGDSLVERKCGGEVARQVQTRASAIVERLEAEGWTEGEALLGDFDFWLRSDSNRRNPGATADLIAATLLVGILSGQLSWDLD
jgi:triphosphoribosyl-dephospho-CoA synthase